MECSGTTLVCAFASSVKSREKKIGLGTSSKSQITQRKLLFLYRDLKTYKKKLCFQIFKNVQWKISSATGTTLSEPCASRCQHKKVCAIKRKICSYTQVKAAVLFLSHFLFIELFRKHMVVPVIQQTVHQTDLLFEICKAVDRLCCRKLFS